MPPQAAGLDTLRVASSLVKTWINRRSTGLKRQSITGILACRGAFRHIKPRTGSRVFSLWMPRCSHHSARQTCNCAGSLQSSCGKSYAIRAGNKEELLLSPRAKGVLAYLRPCLYVKGRKEFALGLKLMVLCAWRCLNVYADVA